MKKIFLVVISLGIIGGAFGQKQSIILKQKNKKIESLIPENWTIIAMDKNGDLNDDGIDDLVFVIKKEDVNNIIANSEIGSDSLDVNPKILGIYFKDKNGCFEKQLQHDTFVVVNNNPTMEEPFQNLEVSNGELTFKFQEFYNAGSWYVNNESYTFKYNEGLFKLIRYSNLNFHRATMESEEENTDYIKGITLITKESFSEDDDEKENPIIKSNTINFTPKKLQSLRELKVPFLFE
ncbi:hypothetical protein [uncultured Aquimarina sp.]|uniref:hypothetical protein n=1 Tax=uncultured Aquimarina sp. TaxID=575652 RepID=UPI002605FF48|nr:hypothetical protein [uncultured Aquimarina sp.]